MSSDPLTLHQVLNRFRVLDVDNKMCVCALCADGGDLVLCDGPSCPLVFHPPCLVASDIPDPTLLADDVSWLCPRCAPTSTCNGLPYDSAICSFERIEQARGNDQVRGHDQARGHDQVRRSDQTRGNSSPMIPDSDSLSPPLPPNSNDLESRKRKRTATFFFSRSSDSVIESRVAVAEVAKESPRREFPRREFRGIFREPKAWRVVLNHGKGRKILIGRWFNEIEAAIAWDLGTLRLKGPHCKRMTLNFPDKLEEYDLKLRSGYNPDEHADIPAREKPQFPKYDTSIEPIRLTKSSEASKIRSRSPTFADFIAISSKNKGSKSENNDRDMNKALRQAETETVRDTLVNFDHELDPLPTQFGDDSHLYYCRLCDNKGSDTRLVLCESCPRVFHHRCVPTLRSVSLSLKWYCPICISLGRGWSGGGLDLQNLSMFSSESSQTTQTEDIPCAVSRSTSLLFREMRSRGSISALFEPSLRHLAVLVARAFSEDDSIAAECALACRIFESDCTSNSGHNYLFSETITISALCLEPLPSGNEASVSKDLELVTAEEGTISSFSDILAKPAEKLTPSRMEWDDLFEKEKEKDASPSRIDGVDEALSFILDDFSKPPNSSSRSLLAVQSIEESAQQISHTLVFEPAFSISANLVDSAHNQSLKTAISHCQYCKLDNPDAKCTTCLNSFHLMCDEESRFANSSLNQPSSQEGEVSSQSFEIDDIVINRGPLACTACLLRSRLVRLIDSERSALLKDSTDFLALNAPWRSCELTHEGCASVAEQASRSISNRAFRLSCLRALWAISGAAATDCEKSEGPTPSSPLIRFGDAFPFIILPPPSHEESKSFYFAAGGSAELGSFSSYSIILDRLVSGVYDVDPPESRTFASSPTKNSRVRAQVQVLVANVDIAHKSPESVLRLPSIQSFVRDLSLISRNAVSHFGKQGSVWDSSSFRHKKMGANAPLVHHATVVALESALLSGACAVLSATVVALSGLRRKQMTEDLVMEDSTIDSEVTQQLENSFIENLAISFANEILAISKALGEEYKVSEEKSLLLSTQVLPSLFEKQEQEDFDEIERCVQGEYNDAVMMIAQSRKKRLITKMLSDTKPRDQSRLLVATLGSKQLNVRVVGPEEVSIEEEESFTTRDNIMERFEKLLKSHGAEKSGENSSASRHDDKHISGIIEPDDTISLRPNDFDWQLASQLRDSGVSLEASVRAAELFSKADKKKSTANFVSTIDEAFLNLAFPVQSSQNLGPQIIPGRGPSKLVPDLSGDFKCYPLNEKIDNSNALISLMFSQRTLDTKPIAIFNGDPLRCDACRYGWLHACAFSQIDIPLSIDGRVHSETKSISTQSSPAHEVMLSSYRYLQEDGCKILNPERDFETRVLQSDVNDLRSSFLRLLALHNHRLLTKSGGHKNESLNSGFNTSDMIDDTSRERRFQLEKDQKLALNSALQLQLSVLGPSKARKEISDLIICGSDHDAQNVTSSIVLESSSPVENRKFGTSLHPLSIFYTDSVVATQILASADNSENIDLSFFLSDQVSSSELFRESSSEKDRQRTQSKESLENELALPGTEDAFHLSTAINDIIDTIGGTTYTQAILNGALRQWRRSVSTSKGSEKFATGCARLRPYVGKRRFFKRSVNAKEYYAFGASGGPLKAPPSLSDFGYKDHASTNTADNSSKHELPLINDFRSSNDDDLESPHMQWLKEDKPSMQSLEARARWSLRTRLVLGTSRIDGLGLFSNTIIESDDVIIEYTGEVISDALCNLRQQMYESKGIADFMFRTSDNEVIDATVNGCRARYINHSCDPNCFAVVTLPEFSQNGRGRRVFIYSKRRILAGEELTYDYCFSADENCVRCFCGQSACRGRLNV